MDDSGNYGIDLFDCVSVLIADGCLPVRDGVAGRRRPTPTLHMPGIGGVRATRRIRAAQTASTNPDPLTPIWLAVC